MKNIYTIIADGVEVKQFKQFRRAVILALKLRHQHTSVKIRDSFQNTYNYSK